MLQRRHPLDTARRGTSPCGFPDSRGRVGRAGSHRSEKLHHHQSQWRRPWSISATTIDVTAGATSPCSVSDAETQVGFHKIEIKELVGEDLLAITAPRDQRAAEEADQYLKQQIQDLELGRRLVNLSKEDIQRREQAVDNLKALGPAAMPAVPALAWAAVNVHQTVVAGKAIELLSEIGGIQGVAPICQSLRRGSSRNR